MSRYKRNRIWVPEAPHLIVNRTREVEVILPPVRVGGIITIRRVGPEGIREQRRSHNIITDTGLNVWARDGTPANAAIYVAVGTGSNAPAATDTSLQAQAGTRSNSAPTGEGNGTTGYVGPGPHRHYYRFVRQFLENSNIDNIALTEVGFFSAATGGEMFNRQLITDEVGTPAPLVKLPDEKLYFDLDIIYVPADYTAVPGQITISGSGTHDVRMQTNNIDDEGYQFPVLWSGNLHYNLGATESNALPPASTDVFASTFIGSTGTSGSTAAYVPGTFYREVTSVWEPTQANFATGIGMLGFQLGNASNRYRYLMALDQKIMKGSTHRLTINWRTGALSRYVP